MRGSRGRRRWWPAEGSTDGQELPGDAAERGDWHLVHAERHREGSPSGPGAAGREAPAGDCPVVADREERAAAVEHAVHDVPARNVGGPMGLPVATARSRPCLRAAGDDHVSRCGLNSDDERRLAVAQQRAEHPAGHEIVDPDVAVVPGCDEEPAIVRHPRVAARARRRATPARARRPVRDRGFQPAVGRERRLQPASFNAEEQREFGLLRGQWWGPASLAGSLG